jgi:tRNA(Ile)-lysidine synthase
LDKEVARLWDKVAQEQEKSVILDKERFLELPSALQRYLLRNAMEKLLGNLKDIETRHIEEIMAALKKPAGKRISLPEELIFSIEYDKYVLSSDLANLSPFPVLKAEFALKIPGKTSLPGWQINAKIIDREEIKAEDNGFTAYFDLAKAGRELTVRPRQSGDRFQPLGMKAPKKLNEFMIDARIPRTWRKRIPIVCSPRHILWVVGWRIDERVKVAETTPRVLRLEMVRSTE